VTAPRNIVLKSCGGPGDEDWWGLTELQLVAPSPTVV
jgi:hypothetical protein